MQVYNVDINSYLIEGLKSNKQNHVLNPLGDNIDIFKQIIENATGYKIRITNNWFNRTEYTGVDNSFPWHNEKGLGGSKTNMPGSHAAILWIEGEVDKGGSLEVVTNDNVEKIELKPGKLIVFEADTLHKVSHYYGATPRTSLNITYKEVLDAWARN